MILPQVPLEWPAILVCPEWKSSAGVSKCLLTATGTPDHPTARQVIWQVPWHRCLGFPIPKMTSKPILQKSLREQRFLPESSQFYSNSVWLTALHSPCFLLAVADGLFRRRLAVHCKAAIVKGLLQVHWTLSLGKPPSFWVIPLPSPPISWLRSAPAARKP